MVNPAVHSHRNPESCGRYAGRAPATPRNAERSYQARQPSILDALNPARNRGSLAHPNDVLLDESEAVLFINAARTTLQYLDAKLSSATSIAEC
jgi:hypothetical protein